MSVRWVHVGEVLRPERQPVEIDPGRNYVYIGVRSFARGLVTYPATPGDELSKMRYFALPPNALVVSNIKAWEGAVATSGPDTDGVVVSNRFLTYLPRSADTAIAFVWHYFASEPGTAALGKASPGSADRNRTLGIAAFENLRIPLPDIDEQRRIAARLDTVAAFGQQLVAASESRQDAHLLAPPLTQDVFDRSGIATVPARELYSTVSDVVHPGDDLAPARRFVGLEHIEPHTGRRLGEAPVQELTGRKLRFATGDVLYGYLRPYQNKVWLADGSGLCSVEQYVLRPKAGVDPRLLAYALRAERPLAAVNAATHHLQLPRVRTALLGAVEVPDVRGASHLVDPLERVNGRVLDLIAATARQRSAMRALLPAARNEEFSRLINS